MGIVFLDGNFVEEEKAFVPVTDRGFLFGDGVFTTLKVSEGKVEFFDAHVERFQKNCQTLNIIPPEIHPQWVVDLIRHNRAFEGTWRLKIVASAKREGLQLEKCSHGRFLITLKPCNAAVKSPLRLGLFPHPIIKPTAPLKSLSYLDRLWIHDYAIKKGFDDAIVTTSRGKLLETAFSNLFWVREKILFYPDAELPLLFGVTLSMLLQAAQTLQLALVPTKASLDDIHPESHLYVCNALKGFVPISQIETKNFPENTPFQKELAYSFQKLIDKHVPLRC